MTRKHGVSVFLPIQADRVKCNSRPSDMPAVQLVPSRPWQFLRGQELAVLSVEMA
jgi:hypothetical protein